MTVLGSVFLVLAIILLISLVIHAIELRDRKAQRVLATRRMTAIFNEWARRYAENPEDFGEIIDADGKPVEDYGQQCALYFNKIADEMDAAGR